MAPSTKLTLIACVISISSINCNRPKFIEADPVFVKHSEHGNSTFVGIIINYSGEPIPGATIRTWMPNESTGRLKYSDQFGRFVLEGLQSSTYIVTVGKRGYKFIQYPIKIEPSMTIVKTFVMEQANTNNTIQNGS